jgi:hypothetical protein
LPLGRRPNTDFARAEPRAAAFGQSADRLSSGILKTRIILAFIGLATFVATTALAADPDDDAKAEDAPAKSAVTTDSAKEPAKPEDSKSPDDPSFGHHFQFGLRAGLVGGYNMIFRYDQSPFCATFDASKQIKDQQKFCGHAAPLALDVALSFAPLDFVEPYIFGRFGLSGEAQTDTNPVSIFGAGARIYTMSDSAFKIFVEPAVAYEFEGGGGAPDFQRNNPQYKKDLLFHLAAGPQLDVAKFVGFYAHAGLTTGILRSIHSELELELGVQSRFP